jgi:CBS domain-containing protein
LAASPPSDQVSNIMSTKIMTVRATDKVSKAFRAMIRHKIGSILVVEKEKPVGILTERDVSTGIEGPEFAGMVVRSIICKPVITVAPSVEVWDESIIIVTSPPKSSGVFPDRSA